MKQINGETVLSDYDGGWDDVRGVRDHRKSIVHRAHRGSHGTVT